MPWTAFTSPPAMQTPQQTLPPGAAAPDLEASSNDIQGDILVGLQKNWQRFLFFTIANPAAFKATMLGLVERITDTATVREREHQLAARKERIAADPALAGAESVLELLGLNVAFTKAGLHALLPQADLSVLAALGKDADAIAATCGDGAAPQPSADWEPAFKGATIHGVFNIAGATRAEVDSLRDDLLLRFGASLAIVWPDGALGNARPGAARGREHFGWLDGISQPAVDRFSTPFPGQTSVPAGHFVFGQAGAPATPIAWMANGSYMVFRKLAQDVASFRADVAAQADQLGIDEALLGARMMGRWKSGAPLALAPLQDDGALGADAMRNNDFDYADDRWQRRCPYGAHVRKTNPRHEPGAPDVESRRIMRAGIPYGPEFDADPTAERGLLFVCYQTSIEGQFEIVQGQWANEPGFPSKTRPLDDEDAFSVGHDPIIGQTGSAARRMDEPHPNHPHGSHRSTLHLARRTVTPRAGLYLFVPSKSALRETLCRPI